MVGEARRRLRPQVHRHGLVAHVPRADGRRRARCADPTRVRPRARAHASPERRVRLDRDEQHGRALSQRQPPARAARVRPARGPAGARGHRLGGADDHRGGRRSLAPVGDERTRVRMRDQRHAAVRLGRDQGAARSRRDPSSAPHRPGAHERSTRAPRSCSSTSWRRVPIRRTRTSARTGRVSGSRRATWPMRCRGSRCSSRWDTAATRGLRRPWTWCSASRTSTDAGGTSTAYRGKLWVDTDPPRAPSKWVTLRACRALKGAVHARR